MNGDRRKAIVLLVGMSAAAALAKVGTPTRKLADARPTDLEAIFPAEFGHWKIDRSVPVVLPAPDLQAKLDAIYNQVLARTYVETRSSRRVMLSVAYGGDQSDGMSVHLPEVCYPAQGFQVDNRHRDRLLLRGRAVPVTRLVTRLGARREPVTYWLTIGDGVASSRMQQKVEQMRYGLKGVIPDGMLIRVSSIGAEADAEFRKQDEFLQALTAAVPEPFAARIVGRAGAAS